MALADRRGGASLPGASGGGGWLRSFGGGLLVTCGLQNVGEPSERYGEELGLHGRISNTPAALLAREVRWDGEKYLLQARAEVRESRVFGADLVLRRTISARMGEPCVRIEDTVCNEGHRPEPLMLLYHINLGWPLLDETARLVGPEDPGEPPEPRDAEAQKGLKDWDTFAPPTPGFANASSITARGRTRKGGPRHVSKIRRSEEG